MSTEKQLEEIKSELVAIRSSCDRMNKHIDFIQGIWDKIRMPFGWLITKVNQMRGVKDVFELQKIENNLAQK